jgi:hypothetical protein
MIVLQQFLINTPWWVYLIFAYLIYRGIMASQPRVISFSRALLLPVIIFALGAHTLLTITTWNAALLINWSITFIIGVAIGWATTKLGQFRVDRDNGLIEVPGSWFTIIIIFIIFACKYYIGYVTAVSPDIAQQTSSLHIIFAISGITMGLLIGRVIHYIYCYKTYQSEKLTVKN